MIAAKIIYRLLKSGAALGTDGENLKVQTTKPLTEKQRQALRDNKADLIDLVDWYESDLETILTLTEDQFVALTRDYSAKREHYRRVQ